MSRWWPRRRSSAPVTFPFKKGGTGVMSRREYRRRARGARRQMSKDQAQAFDLIVVDRLTLKQAAHSLGLAEDEMLRRSVAAFRIHVDAIEAPPRSWWRWW